MSAIALTVALAGNPNSGKTTIFNNMTGARQHVGNYPGVTVEKREGFCRFGDTDLLLVDLPGTYSLTANSPDELVARNVVINDKPDIILNILDASNLERNLYLTLQLLELERPMVLVLNMSDVAEKMGYKIDEHILACKLGVPVIHTVGNRNKGIDELLQVITHDTIESNPKIHLDYGPTLEAKIEELTEALTSLASVRYPKRWLAIKLLENDREVNNSLRLITGGMEVLTLAEKIQAELKTVFADELDIVIAECRYRIAGELYQEMTVSGTVQSRTVSDKIDSVLTHRIIGLPLFLAIMWLLFNIVFTLGHYPQEWIDSGVKWLGDFVGQHMAKSELQSLVTDGIIGGVGAVISFLPQILLLFLGIALLEDTGYMARAAFVMDRIMRTVGLHGKSFIPLLLGFGCNVPAIMGTRTLENLGDRMTTILVVPLMSCNARLPVYTLLISAFFPKQFAGSVLFSIYFIGISLAVTLAMVFRKLLFSGDTETFVMEMPLYHTPTIWSILSHMWERSVLYLKKAGTLILTASILVWFMTNYPGDVSYSQDLEQAKARVEGRFNSQVATEVLQPLGINELTDSPVLFSVISQLEDDEEEAEKELLAITSATLKNVYPFALRYRELDKQRKSEIDKLEKEQSLQRLANSYAGRFGKVIEPLIHPLGFDWKMGVGLVAAVAAKEVLVSTLGTIYSVGDTEGDSLELQKALASDRAFRPLVAYSLMVFTLVYSPCLAAIAVIRRETNSWKWPLFSCIYSTVLAWFLAFAVFQIGMMLGY